MHVCAVRMVVISADGLVLDGSAKAMAGLPTQAFGVMLSGSDIEEMIACVQNGGDIRLSLGSSPVRMEALAQPIICYLPALHNSAGLAITPPNGCAVFPRYYPGLEAAPSLS